MEDTCLIVRDILSTNNASVVIEMKNKIDDIIQLLYDNNKNKTAINDITNNIFFINFPPQIKFYSSYILGISKADSTLKWTQNVRQKV